MPHMWVVFLPVWYFICSIIYFFLKLLQHLKLLLPPAPPWKRGRTPTLIWHFTLSPSSELKKIIPCSLVWVSYKQLPKIYPQGWKYRYFKEKMLSALGFGFGWFFFGGGVGGGWWGVFRFGWGCVLLLITSLFSSQLPFLFVVHRMTKLRKLLLAIFICNSDF